jgi:hypothetical protein
MSSEETPAALEDDFAKRLPACAARLLIRRLAFAPRRRPRGSFALARGSLYPAGIDPN